mgnify:CR=1 FL=1
MSQHRIVVRARIPVVRVDAGGTAVRIDARGTAVRLTVGSGVAYTPPVIDGGTF